MNKKLLFLLLLCPLMLIPTLASNSADTQVANEKTLFRRELPDLPGKEGLIETVVLSPGEVVPAHRHDADVFVYVLEGSIITQVQGGKPRTVHAGEVFYESPTDVHIASRNASTTQPTTLLVFFVKKTGAPPTVAVPKAQ